MIRICGEITQVKRCCMCLPLRHGLILWGYIRLVIGVILLVGVTKTFFELLNETAYVYVVMFRFFVIFGGTDIVLNVVFVYAGHTKNLNMLKAYYKYSLILWILMLIMGISLSAYAVHIIKLYVWFVLLDLCTFLALILIQAYILLLVRSETIKLTKAYEFTFVNNAAESACKMNCEEVNIANGDTDTAHTSIIADGNITAKKDITASTDIIADGNITAKKDITASTDAIAD